MNSDGFVYAWGNNQNRLFPHIINEIVEFGGGNTMI